MQSFNISNFINLHNKELTYLYWNLLVIVPLTSESTIWTVSMSWICLLVFFNKFFPIFHQVKKKVFSCFSPSDKNWIFPRKVNTTFYHSAYLWIKNIMPMPTKCPFLHIIHINHTYLQKNIISLLLKKICKTKTYHISHNRLGSCRRCNVTRSLKTLQTLWARLPSFT